MNRKILIVGKGKSSALNMKDRDFIKWIEINHSITWSEYKTLSDHSKEYLHNEYNKCIEGNKEWKSL